MPSSPDTLLVLLIELAFIALSMVLGSTVFSLFDLS